MTSKFLTALWVTLVLLPVISGRAQTWPSNELYQIVSGNYIQCCGIGGDFVDELPNASQTYIRLQVHDDGQTRLTFLGEDGQTVFTIAPCPPAGLSAFDFNVGLVFPWRIVFHVDPGLNGRYWNYTVSNLVDHLKIDGVHAWASLPCIDVPTDFYHSNVVAVLYPPAPRISDLQREGDRLEFRFTGIPDYDYFVEYSESLPSSAWLSLTNFRAKLQPIEAVVTDAVRPDMLRLYRVRREECRCD